MENKDNKLFFSAPEVAKILKVSRATIVNRIKKGTIKAQMVGPNYLIQREEIEHLLDKKLSLADKKQITDAVEKAVMEYGEAIRMLGKE